MQGDPFTEEDCRMKRDEGRMNGFKRLGAVVSIAVAAVFAFTAIESANAQGRKSIRWATSSVDSYGYKVAASMVKIAEDALGGRIHHHRQSLPVDDRRHESGDGWHRRDRLHGRCRHDAALCRRRRVQELHARKGKAGARLVLLSDGVVHGHIGQGSRQVQVLGRLQRQAGVLHHRRLHELAELPAHLQDARLPVQARPDRRQDPERRAAGRHHRRLGRLHDRRPLARAATGRRPRCAWT